MRTVKIASLLALTLLFAAACEDPKFVSREEYDNLAKEYEDLKAGSEAIRQEYATQAQAVDDILDQISQISGSTTSRSRWISWRMPPRATNSCAAW